MPIASSTNAPGRRSASSSPTKTHFFTRGPRSRALRASSNPFQKPGLKTPARSLRSLTANRARFARTDVLHTRHTQHRRIPRRTRCARAPRPSPARRVCSPEPCIRGANVGRQARTATASRPPPRRRSNTCRRSRKPHWVGPSGAEGSAKVGRREASSRTDTAGQSCLADPVWASTCRVVVHPHSVFTYFHPTV
jgi:hypothetical protein